MSAIDETEYVDHALQATQKVVKTQRGVNQVKREERRPSGG